ncbi:MAG: hypothetical protein E6R06_26055 [Mycobacterium sp.]|nr:MAG: hypothetical protein E6R06_26055 [Mycobacterium sp.]
MAGDANNIRVWEAGDVLLYTGTGPFNPADDIPETVDDDFSSDWDYIGMLLGDPGFDLERNFETKEISAWRYGKVKKRRKGFALTVRFSPLEDNPTIEALVNPGSTATDLLVPTIKGQYIAFQTIADDGYVERRISKLPADIWVPKDFMKEDPDAREVEVDVYPDSSGSLFARQLGIPA